MGTKLFVGNLSYQITEQQLREAFALNNRTVQSVRIALDRETGQPRGFAFVEMATDADADSAIKELSTTQLLGRTIYVEKAQERGAPGAPRPPRPERPPGPPGTGMGGPRPGGPPGSGPPRPFGGPPRSFSPGYAEPQREEQRRHKQRPDKKAEKRRSSRPEEKERGKWRWDGDKED